MCRDYLRLDPLLRRNQLWRNQFPIYLGVGFVGAWWFASKYIDLVIAIGAFGWFVSQPDWEPALFFITTIVAYIAPDRQSLKQERTWNNEEHPDVVVADRGLFQEFMRDLPSTGAIDFLRQHDMATRFDDSQFDPLWSFSRKWDLPEFAFHLPELDRLRAGLHLAVIRFLKYEARIRS